jgi:hypothetical protein
MAIFTSVFESQTDNLELELESADTEYNFDEADTFDDTITEYCKEMYALDAAMYIADVQLETAVFEGATDVETLAENAVTDFFKNLIEKIKDIYYKVKEWIREKITNIRAFFAAATSFMDKHGNDVIKNYEKNAAAAKWTYTGYTYLADKSEKDILDINAKANEHIMKAMSAYNESPEGLDQKTTMLIGDIGKAFNANKDVTTISELGAAIIETNRGDYVTDDPANATIVSKWVTSCKKAKETLNAIDKAGQAAERAGKMAIAEVKKLEKEAKKDKREKDATALHAQGRYLAQAMAIQSKMITTVINVNIEAYKAFASRCKSIYKIKGSGSTKKDDSGAETQKESATSSLFENAFNYL